MHLFWTFKGIVLVINFVDSPWGILQMAVTMFAIHGLAVPWFVTIQPMKCESADVSCPSASVHNLVSDILICFLFCHFWCDILNYTYVVYFSNYIDYKHLELLVYWHNFTQLKLNASCFSFDHVFRLLCLILPHFYDKPQMYKLIIQNNFCIKLLSVLLEFYFDFLLQFHFTCTQ